MERQKAERLAYLGGGLIVGATRQDALGRGLCVLIGLVLLGGLLLDRAIERRDDRRKAAAK